MEDAAGRMIYLVTAGDYSDYRVEGVFDDRALAEAFVERFSGTDYGEQMEIEERPLNPLVREVAAGYGAYRVEMNRDGSEALATSAAGTHFFLSAVQPDSQRLWGRVLARDERHAIKILNEYRTRLLAEPWGASSVLHEAAMEIEPDDAGPLVPGDA